MRVLFFLLMAGVLCAQDSGDASVRILLGMTDQQSTKWDGSVTAERGHIQALEPWRFDRGDAMTGGDSWRISTHIIRLVTPGIKEPTPVVANGVIVRLSGATEDTRLQVKTLQGDFSLRLGDMPYGKAQYALDGRAMADRIPPATQITNTPDEQDYPAAATDKNGDIWLAYLEFRHYKDHDRLRYYMKEAPQDFSEWKAPSGGDHILVRKYARGKWSEPIAITEPGGDVYRPAIATDGSGRVWVFWPSNQKGDFDIRGRAIENGKPGATVRLSAAPGADIDPVAATDSGGRVWVAWQGWRNGKASIFCAIEQGNGFSKEFAVASSAANEWNPAIAADKSGRVTVAWDSYRAGNYDVYARTATAPGAWGRETPVAATARYEAYPSIAYDPAGKLWIAYEEGAERWGKDFGAYNTNGLALYSGRSVRLVALDAGGTVKMAATDVGTVLPGSPEARVDSPARQGDSDAWLSPRMDTVQKRDLNFGPAPIYGPKNSLPRLLAESSGRLWLAFRSAQPVWCSFLGMNWTEHLVSYDGTAWTGPIYLSHSDNLLDNRPALVSPAPGQLMVIGSSDSRQQYYLALQYLQAMASATYSPEWTALSQPGVHDPYNNDLYANLLALAPATGPVSVKQAAAPAKAVSLPADEVEKRSLSMLRSYRMKSRSGTLRIVRGEFHRHSEISLDGGYDGTLIDQWRYMLDPGGMDWVGCCDHDNGNGREYSWWITQKLTDVFNAPGRFTSMFSYERSVQYPEGHRNVVFVERGIRPLSRLPKMAPESTGSAPDTRMFYAYLRQFDGVVASHTSGTNMGTDWRDNDPLREPMVEIFQGDRQNYEMPDAPRSNTAKDSIGGWQPKGFINLALEKGYKMAFQASSDHISTHMSYCNIYVKDNTRESVLDAMKKRHVYAATENILADVTSGEYMMGDEFSTSSPPELRVKFMGTAPFAKVHIVKDSQYVYSTAPGKAQVDFTWKDNTPQAGKMSYYYVRGEQEDGEIVWASPMWVTYTGK